MNERARISRGAGAAPKDGPMVSLADALDRVLDRGVCVEGNLTIGLAEVELIYLDLRLLLGSIDTIWPEGRPDHGPRAAAREPGPAGEIPRRPDAENGRASSHADDAEDVALAPVAPAPKARSTADGLARLVLTIVKLLHDVLERQAVRRMTANKLTPREIENLGAALLAQAREISQLCRRFGFAEDDLDPRLGVAR